MARTLTAVLHNEGDLFVADCPEVGTVSQGTTIEEAIRNLREATELYLEEFLVSNESVAGSGTGVITRWDPKAPGKTLAEP